MIGYEMRLSEDMSSDLAYPLFVFVSMIQANLYVIFLIFNVVFQNVIKNSCIAYDM